MTTTEAARALHCSLSTARNLARRGLLVAPRDRRGNRVFDAEVVAVLGRRRRWRPTKHCLFCGSSHLVDGRRMTGPRLYCDGEFCRKARQRIRQRQFLERRKRVAA
jgi:excisionase family DNA binding protein